MPRRSVLESWAVTRAAWRPRRAGLFRTQFERDQPGLSCQQTMRRAEQLMELSLDVHSGGREFNCTDLIIDALLPSPGANGAMLATCRNDPTSAGATGPPASAHSSCFTDRVESERPRAARHNPSQCDIVLQHAPPPSTGRCDLAKHSPPSWQCSNKNSLQLLR
jgi:hypothetical protein